MDVLSQRMTENDYLFFEQFYSADFLLKSKKKKRICGISTYSSIPKKSEWDIEKLRTLLLYYEWNYTIPLSVVQFDYIAIFSA